jgi:hypothetical protein
MRRNEMTKREKDLLSKLSKIINYSEFIHANLTIAKRTCGNPRCRCVLEGKKHASLYLTTIRKDGKRKSVYIPKRLEEEVKAAVKRYFKIRDTLEEVSDINLLRLLSKKEKR